MSEENVALSKRVLEAWNRRDVEATIALASPEVVWHPVLEETIEGQTYCGHAGLRQYYRDLAEQGGESQGELTEFRDLATRFSAWVAFHSGLPSASISILRWPVHGDGAKESALRHGLGSITPRPSKPPGCRSS
jgi:ketosteroid isomerase-like protein